MSDLPNTAEAVVLGVPNAHDIASSELASQLVTDAMNTPASAPAAASETPALKEWWEQFI